MNLPTACSHSNSLASPIEKALPIHSWRRIPWYVVRRAFETVHVDNEESSPRHTNVCAVLWRCVGLRRETKPEPTLIHDDPQSSNDPWMEAGGLPSPGDLLLQHPLRQSLRCAFGITAARHSLLATDVRALSPFGWTALRPRAAEPPPHCGAAAAPLLRSPVRGHLHAPPPCGVTITCAFSHSARAH